MSENILTFFIDALLIHLCMFNNDVLREDLFGLVGSLQTRNPSFPQLVNSLVTPRKKRFIQKEHPLLSIDNIDQLAKNYSMFLYPEWVLTTTYTLGQQVRYTVDGNSYEYIGASSSSGNLPTDTNFWQPINELSDYLIQRQKDAIDGVLDYIMEKRMIKGVTKTVLESIQLYDRATDYRDPIINDGRFVGLALKLKDHRNLKAIIQRIGLQFSQSVNDLTLYCYHSSQQQPIATATVNQSRDQDFIWHNVLEDDFCLQYFGRNTDVGGIFYIGYYQQDLGTSQAYRKNYNWDVGPSSGNCCKSDYHLWESWSDFVQVHPFQFDSSDIDYTNKTLPDIGSTIWSYSTNFGMNLSFSVQCDLTDYIVDNESTLANAILKKWALLLLTDMVNSTRENNTESRVVRLAAAAISKDNSDNYVWKVKSALKALEFDLSDLNEACSPCRDEWGAEWGVF